MALLLRRKIEFVDSFSHLAVIVVIVGGGGGGERKCAFWLQNIGWIESYGGVVVTSSIGLSLPRERLFE